MRQNSGVAKSVGARRAVPLQLLFVPGKVGVFSFVGLFGVGFGAIMLARAALIAEFYGAVA